MWPLQPRIAYLQFEGEARNMRLIKLQRISRTALTFFEWCKAVWRLRSMPSGQCEYAPRRCILVAT